MNKTRIILGVVFLTLTEWLVSTAAVTWQMTRRPHEVTPEPPPRVDWASIENVSILTADGLRIGGWYAASPSYDGCALVLLDRYWGALLSLIGEN